MKMAQHKTHSIKCSHKFSEMNGKSRSKLISITSFHLMLLRKINNGLNMCLIKISQRNPRIAVDFV